MLLICRIRAILAGQPFLRCFLEPKQFSKLQDKCRKSLHRLQSESDKTFNLLALVRRFPDSMESRTALVLQLENENKAQIEYEKHRRRLCALLIGSSECEKIKPQSERKPKRKADEIG